MTNFDKHLYLWVEVELHYNWNAEYIANKEKLSLYKFNSKWIKWSKEYYQETMEYNFAPFNFNRYWKLKFTNIETFLTWQVHKYNLRINYISPAYVWTHVHIFNKKYFNKKSELLKLTMQFIVDNLQYISRWWIDRLMRAHQLWAYHNKKNNNIIAKTLYDKWIGFSSMWKDKKKYQPILLSLANQDSWKPKSIEIRLIPNDIWFTPWKMEGFFHYIEDSIKTNTIPEITEEIFINKLIEKYYA